MTDVTVPAEGPRRRATRSPSRPRTASTRCSPSPARTSSRCTTARSRPTPPMRLLDVRHEQTAVFAAEAIGKLTRVPGLAVLTAGPGRHQRRQRRDPGAVQRLAAGRRRRPGAGEPLGHGQPAGARPPAAARARHQAGAHRRTTVGEIAGARRRGVHARRLARTAGRSSSTCRWTQFFDRAAVGGPAACAPGDAARARPGRARRRSRALLADGAAAGAGARHRRLGRRGRGGGAAARRGDRRCRSSPTAWAAASSPAATRCWSPGPAATAFGSADLVVVVGTPLDFRLGYGVFGGKDGAPRRRVVHLADSPGQVSRPRRRWPPRRPAT